MVNLNTENKKVSNLKIRRKIFNTYIKKYFGNIIMT